MKIEVLSLTTRTFTDERTHVSQQTGRAYDTGVFALLRITEAGGTRFRWCYYSGIHTKGDARRVARNHAAAARFYNEADPEDLALYLVVTVPPFKGPRLRSVDSTLREINRKRLWNLAEAFRRDPALAPV